MSSRGFVVLNRLAGCYLLNVSTDHAIMRAGSKKRRPQQAGCSHWLIALLFLLLKASRLIAVSGATAALGKHANFGGSARAPRPFGLMDAKNGGASKRSWLSGYDWPRHSGSEGTKNGGSLRGRGALSESWRSRYDCGTLPGYSFGYDWPCHSLLAMAAAQCSFKTCFKASYNSLKNRRFRAVAIEARRSLFNAILALKLSVPFVGWLDQPASGCLSV